MPSAFSRRILKFCGFILVLAIAIALDIYNNRPRPLEEYPPSTQEEWEAHRDDKMPAEVPDPVERITPRQWGGSNIVCWPSVEGIIVVQDFSNVELDYIGFNPGDQGLERYLEQDMEDKLCLQFRRIGGKWWLSYFDYVWATEMQMRYMSASEKEVLLLGWPSTGGVWVVRLDNRTVPWKGSNLTKLASTMDERCEALKQNGATFYKDPNDCDHVKGLLDGFGEHKEEDNTPYDQMSPSRASK
jgi:hypothetical protein